MSKVLKKLIKEIKILEESKGKPFNSVKLKKARENLTNEVLKISSDILEIGNWVLKIGYVKKDILRPYTQIFTKESFTKYKEYSENY